MASKLNTVEGIAKAATVMREVYRNSRCACGCGGSWENYVSGSVGGKPAIWMGCARENGRAVGGGLTGDDYHVAHAVLNACRKLDVDICEIFDAEAQAEYERKQAAEARRHAARVAEYEQAERERPEREARRREWLAAVERRKIEYRPLFDAAMAKCRIKANGKIHRGDAREVEIAYAYATGAADDNSWQYDEDLAYWHRVLTRLSVEGPTVAEAVA